MGAFFEGWGRTGREMASRRFGRIVVGLTLVAIIYVAMILVLPAQLEKHC